MSIDIGRVFSNTVAMVKERWLAMIGLWATFLGFLFVYGIVVFAVLGGTIMASGAMMGGAGFDNPAALGGLGIGIIVMVVIAYIGYFAIMFGQQGSMAAMASPLHQISFGEAFSRGLKGGLTFLGVLLLFIVAYIVAALLFALVVLILQFLGDFAVIVAGILALPAIIYLICRFSVIVPVIVVEKIFNPIKAINRTWQITSGNVLSILVVYIVFAVAALVLMVVPYMLLGATFDLAGGGAGAGVLTGIFIVLLFIALFLAFTLFASSLVASLHAEMSDTQAVELGKTFE
jgi:hypothetical protein